MSRILELLVSCYEYDVAVFSKPWLYYWLLIPAGFYLMFFFIKWTVLTAPVWIPLKIMASSFRRSRFALRKNQSTGTTASSQSNTDG